MSRSLEKIVDPLLREVENLNTRNKLSEYYNQFLDEVYSENDFTYITDSDTELDEHFFQIPPQTHQHTPTPQPDNTSTPPSQDVSNENAGKRNRQTQTDYDGSRYPKKMRLMLESFNQPDTEHNEVGATSPQNTASPQDAADATNDEYGWTEAEPDTEPTIAEEATGEENVSEQQPQPETNEQKKQAQSF